MRLDFPDPNEIPVDDSARIEEALGVDGKGYLPYDDEAEDWRPGESFEAVGDASQVDEGEWEGDA
jgi:hypothetical protein